MARPQRPTGGSAGRQSTGKDPDLVALGARLRTLRERSQMTQEELAHAAGLHWTYVGQVERGERNLTYRSLLRLASGLGVELAQLVRLSDCLTPEIDPATAAEIGSADGGGSAEVLELELAESVEVSVEGRERCAVLDREGGEVSVGGQIARRSGPLEQLP